MNIFDIIGPVMIGPSSSHTAGVVRIGNFVRKIIGYTPKNVVIKFHGSFAKTYIGHGSDKAIIGGILGLSTDAPEIKNSLQIAKEQGINYSFETVKLNNAHPNTIIVESTLENSKKLIILAESVGGANIIIKKIDDIDIKFDGKYDAIIIKHKDTTGILSKITGILSNENINIAHMSVYRTKKGGETTTIIETDGVENTSVTSKINLIEDIKTANLIQRFI